MFEATAFDEYQKWIKNDKKLSLKIGSLIQDTLKNPFIDLGSLNRLKEIFKVIGAEEFQMSTGLFTRLQIQVLSLLRAIHITLNNFS